MSSRAAWKPIRRVCLLMALAGCSHSVSYLVGSYAETGPLIPGPEANLGRLPAPSWTEDGKGMIYAHSCYGVAPWLSRRHYPPESVSVAGMALMPSTGGSVTWERCELEVPFVVNSDSDVTFPSAAMGKGGRLLYTEFIAAHEHGDGYDKFPIYFHVDLFLGDSARPLNANRKLLTLFRERSGVANVPPAGINQLTRLTWIGTDEFLAEGHQYRVDRSQEFLGLVRGTVTPDSAILAIIPGTAGTRRWSAAESGATLIYVTDSLTVRRIAVAGGQGAVVATIPAGGRRNIIDVSCRGDLCLVLTNEDAVLPARSSTFWTVTLGTGVVQPVRTDLKSYLSAQLSPASNVVLVGEVDGMHLFSELLH